jgi:hypothetical protein
MSLPRYYIKTESGTTGPHSLDALRQMAELRAFTEEALVAQENSTEWTLLRDLIELHAELFPPAARKFTLKEKSIDVINIKNNGDTPITVEAILHANLTRQQVSEPALSFEVKRPNRRHRDYWLLMIAGNLFGATLAVFLPHNPFVMVFLLSFFVVFNLGLYWVAFHVMARY